MHVEGTSPGTSTRSLQASTISVETGIWSISFRWPKTWVYWSSFGLDPTYVQSGTWWVGLWTQLIQLLKSVFRVQSTAISEVFQNNNLATDTLIYFMNPQTFKIFSNILVINNVDLLCVFVLLTRVGCLPGFSTRKTLCCGLLIQVRIQDKQAEWWHMALVLNVTNGSVRLEDWHDWPVTLQKLTHWRMLTQWQAMLTGGSSDLVQPRWFIWLTAEVLSVLSSKCF